MRAAQSAFVDWWDLDEGAARQHAAAVIAERRGEFRRVCLELGMRAETVMHGRMRLTPCGKFVLGEYRSGEARKKLFRPL
jgi:hypothetical protein